MMEFARLASSLSSHPARQPHNDHRQIQNLCSIVCTAGYQRPLGELLLNLTRQRAKEELLCISAPYSSGAGGSGDDTPEICKFIMQLTHRVRSFLQQQTLLESAFQ